MSSRGDLEIAELEKEETKLRVSIEKLSEKLTGVIHKLSLLKNQRDFEYLKNRPKDINKDIEIMLMGNPDSTSMYKEQQKLLKEYGLGSSGYYSGTGQNAIQITFYRNKKDTIKKVYKGLCTVLPSLLPPQKGQDVTISIFEHTLSANGVYKLCIRGNTPESSCYLEHSYREDIEFKNLMDALIYIEKNHWYD
jgi:hypothetical protein